MEDVSNESTEGTELYFNCHTAVSTNILNNSDSDSDSDLDADHTEGGITYDHSIYESGIATKKLSGDNSLTVLQALALNFHFFSSHPSVSKACFSDQLKLQKTISNSDSLPSTYHEAKQMVKPYLIQKIEYSACVNDCVIYRKSEKYDYSDLQICPVCHEPRYNVGSKGRLYPRRRFLYIPLGPRLARLYGDANLAQIVQSHSSSPNNENEMWDIHDSPEWKCLYGEDGYFEKDSMGVSYALELDGVNPYHNIGVRYSMTPIMLTILNLPRFIRNAFGSIQLVGIIPGNGRSEASNVQPYVDILVDELLSFSGCTVYNAFVQAPTSVKVKLLLHVLDYPGLSKLFHQHGSGSLQGCHWCWIRGTHIPELDKVVYLSNRSYLEAGDALRKDSNKFKDRSEDHSHPPGPRSKESERDYRQAFDNAKNTTKSSVIARATGCKGTYSLCRLPGHDRADQCVPDACHTIKDVIQNVMKLLTGKANIPKIANYNTYKVVCKSRVKHVCKSQLQKENVLQPPQRTFLLF